MNPGKCKVMYSGRATRTQSHFFGDSVISEVDTLKYLGYWIGKAGRSENDRHLVAQATQLRFKIRVVLPVLGEMLTLVLLESHETPRVLFGAELGNLTAANLNKMHGWSISEALGVGRYEASQGYTSREVSATVVWSDYEGSTWSQLRARNAKVLYRSVRRMGPDTAPAERLRKVGHNNVLVDCFMRGLNGTVPEDNQAGLGEGRKAMVTRCLKWNSVKETKKLKWKAAEAKSMRNETLIWRRGLNLAAGKKCRDSCLLSQADRIHSFGSTSTVFMKDTKSSMGLEKSISHMSTKVSTGVKIAARKIKGGRIRGMKVLAHMNTGSWETMGHEDRGAALQCACGGEIQHGEHLLTGCEYMIDHVDEAILAIRHAVQPEAESAKQELVQARGVREVLRTVVSMDTRKLTGEALQKVGSSLRKLVRRTEGKLRQVNQAGDSWPVDALRVWAPEGSDWQPGALCMPVCVVSEACIQPVAAG